LDSNNKAELEKLARNFMELEYTVKRLQFVMEEMRGVILNLAERKPEPSNIIPLKRPNVFTTKPEGPA
jgi:hypothetical protein